MRQRLARILLTFAAFTVVWLAAGSARAMTGAPICDPRGATSFAPPPQMQDPLTSLDIVTNDDDCTESPLTIFHVTPERTPPRVDTSSSQEPAAARAVAIAFANRGGERLPAPAASEVCSRPGFRSTFERPPRR